MKGKLVEFVNDYNQNKRLKSLNYKTPTQYLKENKNIALKLIEFNNQTIIQRIVIAHLSIRIVNNAGDSYILKYKKY
ncbi:MAG: hypothetical protein CEN89_239 [Candidatus Berkelbacteria bacterium Licking1014_7]|uniref:Uncharacterized protein n=1 Tax=Candidatus Berkelbacteria bacterium Licking1014_7 TaxID=2017147 RepID=A0A554LJV3_9BACT|nr:MAG: hypothetical protein CEN89_239 [Candidatus Berkelbacteria bacterium Licking1014_7]